VKKIIDYTPKKYKTTIHTVILLLSEKISLGSSQTPIIGMSSNIEFRKRINQHFSSKFVADAAAVGSKSTKEIAREAVQEEFRTKSKKRKLNRRGGDDDYLSSGDEGDKKSKEKNGPIRRSSEQDSAAPMAVAHGPSTAPVYRDRAKERREGSIFIDNLDSDQHQQRFLGHASIMGQTSSHNQLAIGSEQRFPHNGFNEDCEDIDLDCIQQTALMQKQAISSKQEKQLQQQQTPRDLDLPALFSRIQSSTCSTVGKGVFTHLQNVLNRKDHKNLFIQIDESKIPSSSFTTTSFQQSNILFSLKANIHDSTSSWEIPKEIILSREDEYHTMGGIWKNKQGHASTPLDLHLIQKIKTTFESQSSKLLTSKVSKSSSSSKHHFEERSSDIYPSTENIHGTTKQQQQEDDDDIFSGIGEYVPPMASTSEDTTSHGTEQHDICIEKSVDKVPIFQPIVQSNTSHDQTGVKRQLLLRHTAKQTMDRSTATDPYSNDRGIGINSYHGDYGEEMDIDFDGSMEAEVREMSQIKGSKRKVDDNKIITTAVLEYGSRGEYRGRTGSTEYSHDEM